MGLVIAGPQNRRWSQGGRRWAVVAVLLMCGASLGQPAFLNLDEHAGPEPRSDTRSFPFVVHPSQTKLYFDVKVTLSAGQLTLRILDANGTVLREDRTDGSLSVQGSVPAETHGTFQLEAVTEDAVGEWKAQVCPLLPASAFRLDLISGPAMILVALGSVFYWRARSKASWRWFWVGAAIWTVGVALKFSVGILGNRPILHALNQSLPNFAYLATSAVYIGLLTGVFEIGVTLAAGLIWRKLAVDAPRGIAVGVGAGAFEAALLGLGALAMAVPLALGTAPDSLVAQSTQVALLTPVGWLAGPIERGMAILCHTASRALTLLTVVTGRWRYFWWGFALMTVLDGIAGAFLLSGLVTKIAVWWIELAILPAAIVSVPIIRWCASHWPVPMAAAPAPAPEPPEVQPSA